MTKTQEVDLVKENLAKMAEEMKVTTGYPRENAGWNAACDEIASRIRFTKAKSRERKS